MYCTSRFFSKVCSLKFTFFMHFGLRTDCKKLNQELGILAFLLVWVFLFLLFGLGLVLFWVFVWGFLSLLYWINFYVPLKAIAFK